VPIIIWYKSDLGGNYILIKWTKLSLPIFIIMTVCLYLLLLNPILRIAKFCS